jgi:glucose/arabinose dehydrogenase
MKRALRAVRTGAAWPALTLIVATLAGCAGNSPFGNAQPQPLASTAPAGPTAPPAAAAPPAPSPASTSPSPPPIDLVGRWKLAVAGGGACFMRFGNAPGAAQGTIAPEGGCPGKFFTSRKWTFDHDTLTIRDHKNETLAQLSYVAGRFEGSEASGIALTLSR